MSYCLLLLIILILNDRLLNLQCIQYSIHCITLLKKYIYNNTQCFYIAYIHLLFDGLKCKNSSELHTINKVYTST